ncbi:MAG: hypothetical protein RSD57_13575 [Comamonas sp.]
MTDRPMVAAINAAIDRYFDALKAGGNPPPTTPMRPMDRDELVRLAGEQALLKRELDTIGAEQNRDKQALQNIMSDIGRTIDWHATGTQLLDRLKEREDKMANGYARLREYAKSTGIQ